MALDRHRYSRFRHTVLAAQRLGNRVLAAELEPHGVTPAAAEVLSVLAQFQPLTIRQLGRLIVCEADHPSRLVARLKHDGLIATAADPADGRALQLTLTDAGSQLATVVNLVESRLDQAIARQAGTNAIDTVVEVLSGLLEPEQQHALSQRFPPTSSS